MESNIESEVIDDMKKSFTLIELIVTIVVISIISAIVIPNISSFKQEATLTATSSNVNALQTSVDLYSLDNNGSYPTYEEQPTVNIPQPVNFNELYPKYVRSLPNTYGSKYWIDSYGKVWASTVDAPQGIKNEGGILSWEKVDNAEKYNIFRYEGYSGVLGNASEEGNFTYIGTTSGLSYTVEDNGNYVISAVDSEGVESVPAGSGYTGYISLGDLMNKDSSEISPEFIELKQALEKTDLYVGDFEMTANLNLTMNGSETISSEQSEGTINGMNLKVKGTSTSAMFGTPTTSNYETVIIGNTAYYKSALLGEEWLVINQESISDLSLENVDTIEATISDITASFANIQIAHLEDTVFHSENVKHFQMKFDEETFKEFLSKESILSQTDLTTFSVEQYTVDMYIKDSELVGLTISNKINSELYGMSVSIYSYTEQYYKNRGVITSIVAPI